ncbi:tyrosine-type recombinase/integrase [Hymenobacter sp. ASUV-10]|uniref:Tyrosine recombinase XerC n=1 Tax=Hymenobacter aranciens TaxID=3063996 RepID=A0ABT9BAF7_9BACT|nr:tyrosine-type recombinase/integrase [Hymenobacter sp. ASUV-10]MDO7875254.1 tyrosine-type recombinase/integrase [Hymenobacter sp. ASUV-10]
MEAFFDFLRTELRYSPHTLTSYKNDLRQFAAYLQSAYELSDPAQARYPLIRGWIVELMKDGNEASTVNRKVACLRSYYKFLLRTEKISVNPMLRVKAPKMPKKLPEFVPEEAINGLLNNFEFTQDFAGARDQLILELLYGTGIRLSELLGIAPGDISLWNQTILVTGKGDKQRLVPLNPSLLRSLERYQAHRSHSFGPTAPGPLLLTDKGEALYEKFVYRTVKRYLSTITTSVGQQHPHTLRHAFATHLLNKGADLNAIKELLGHASLASTQVYTNLSVERLKSVFEQAHPRA